MRAEAVVVKQKSAGGIYFPAVDAAGGKERRTLLVIGENREDAECNCPGAQPVGSRVVESMRLAPWPVERPGADDRLRAEILEDFAEIVLSRCIDHMQISLSGDTCGRYFAALAAKAQELGVSVAVTVNRSAQECDARLQSALDLPVLPEHPSVRGLRYLAKRAIDVSLTAVALVVLSPLVLAIAIAVKATSRGPVFFLQERVGYRRRTFRMWKFRTMVENAEALRSQVEALNNARGISFKVFRDPRLTRIGSFLRRSSLDELPQLINVLLGEMTLVGPRPIPVWVAEQLEEHSYFRRFSVMPGLTGLWQVEGREQDFDRMARQDLRYVDGWSLALDLRLLTRTLPAVLRGEGAH